MSVSSQITRLNNAKAAIIAAIEAKGVSVPDDALIDTLAEYIAQIEAFSSDADTVDGYHIAVNSNGAAPTTSSQTITFVYGG
jgi:hypothetical protein